MTRLSEAWSGWPEEPRVEAWSGWRLLVGWAIVLTVDAALLAGMVYGTLRIVGLAQ